MKGKVRTVVSGASVVMLTSLTLVAVLGGTGNTVDDSRASDALRRLAADFEAFGFEVATDADPFPDAEGGAVIYDKTFTFLPPRANVAYVSVFGTADTHGGQALALACKFDGVPCQKGPLSAGFAPTGWINLLNEPIGSSCNHGEGGGGGDCHDNGVAYQWCIPVELGLGLHNVQVKIASLDTPTSDGTSQVFMEGLYFYIDASFIKGVNRCIEVFPPEGLAPRKANQA